MDTRTGRIYESREAALEDGVPEDRLVTGTPEALEDIQQRLGLQFRKHKPFASIKNTVDTPK